MHWQLSAWHTPLNHFTFDQLCVFAPWWHHGALPIQKSCAEQCRTPTIMSFWHGDCHTPQWEHNDPTTKGSTQLRSTRSARPRHSCATHERARGACRECQKIQPKRTSQQCPTPRCALQHALKPKLQAPATTPPPALAMKGLAAALSEHKAALSEHNNQADLPKDVGRQHSRCVTAPAASGAAAGP